VREHFGLDELDLVALQVELTQVLQRLELVAVQGGESIGVQVKDLQPLQAAERVVVHLFHLPIGISAPNFRGKFI
jgi:hypothetical protein